ncbi:hypothetical protein L950_0227390 [Sphingobacterium sp. IITKGP-BTPF85]|nr:hypothetical protein L950_0227390 [Sphingobacterium sp. IITKGP-BTPF85]
MQFDKKLIALGKLTIYYFNPNAIDKNNSSFNYLEFGVIGQEAGTNRFIMSVSQWIERTQAR